jgi:hypothetical protein
MMQFLMKKKCLIIKYTIWFLCSLFYRPYDVASYEEEIDEDDVLDEEGRARLKLKVNIIDNKLIVQSC